MNKYYFNAISKMIMDLFSVPLIIIIAYTFKFKLGWLAKYFFDLNIATIYHHAQVEPYLKHIVVMSISMVIIFLVLGVYKKFDGVMYRIEEIFTMIKALSVSVIILLAASLIYGIIPDSRGTIFIGWIIGALILIFTRKVIDNVTNLIFPLDQERVVFIGASQDAQILLENMLNSRKKVNYIGTYAKSIPSEFILSIKNHFKYLGEYNSQRKNDLIKNNVSAVYIDSSEYNTAQIKSLVIFCEGKNITTHIIQSNKNFIHGMAQLSEIGGIALISYPTFYFSKATKFIKRTFDLILSTVALLCLSPIFLLISSWIKLVSPKGAVYYIQERTGIDNKVFNMVKFRTMHPNAEHKSGPVWVSKDETRYIKGGKFLRKYSLDELPQLLNIIKGDMSIVGPRPERPFFVEEITKDVPHFKLRHSVKGGLTGWAQIHGRAHMTNKPAQKVKYDLYYISNWSFILDIKIIFKTFFMVLKGEQAY